MTQRSLFKSGCNSKGSFDNFQLQIAKLNKRNWPFKIYFWFIVISIFKKFPVCFWWCFLCALYYNRSKMRCTGKMAPPDENFVNAHSQHRQNFSSGPGTSNFWTVVGRADDRSLVVIEYYNRPVFLEDKKEKQMLEVGWGHTPGSMQAFVLVLVQRVP